MAAGMLLRMFTLVALIQCARGGPSQDGVHTPTPEDIEKLICKFATQKEIEDRATQVVCEKIQAKFQHFQFEHPCDIVLEKLWDKAVAKCPQYSKTFPTPEDIEKLICQFATQTDIEDRATKVVCEKIQAKFPQFQFERSCEIVLEKVWDKAIAKCPQYSQTFPTPEDIEKLICKFATQKEIEDRATKIVCDKIQAKFPKFQFEPSCEIVLEKLWEKAVAKCPQYSKTFLTPEDIEKLICRFATQTDIEDRATKAVCEKIQTKFPQFQFEHPCEIVLEKLWDKAVAKCPQYSKTSPTPEDVEKLICQFATQTDIEDRATKAVCEKIQAKFPQFQFERSCEIVLEKVWDKVVANCPHEVAVIV